MTNKKINKIFAYGIIITLIFSGIIYFQPTNVDAASTSYAFTSSSDYTFDSTKLAFSSGQVQLERTPAWWDSNYAYRKKITVTASSTTAIATGNTITVNTDIASLVSGSKMQADYDDLRIVYWNGSANTNIDRDVLANGLGAIAVSPGNAPVNSDIRFKAQADVSTSASDEGYYMYYGYASASAGPVTLSNVYSYYNDFSATGTWAFAGLSTWQINANSSGRLQKTTTEASDKYAGDTSNGFSFTSIGGWYSEVTSQRTATTNTVGHAWVTAVPEASGFGIRTTTFGAAANDLEIWRAAGAIKADSSAYGTFITTTGVDYRSTLRVTYGTSCPTDTRVTGWIDGTTRTDITGINSGNCLTPIYPGVHAWNSQASWDDYKVWKVLDETISVGSEQTKYPNDDPTVQPSTNLTFSSLSAFSETATKNSGEIKYILSNDGGTTWYYYNSGWTTSDGTYSQASTASTINTNASTFPVGSGSFTFKAFLHSDGTQLVQLDNISLTYNNNPSATWDNDWATWQGKSSVVANYNLIDLDTDTSNISQTGTSGMEYSTDGSSWSDATMGSGGDGLTGLASAVSPGTNHVFVWDSATDLPTTEDSTVYLRVRPNDGTDSAGSWTSSNSFGIDNVAPSSVGAPTFGTITASSIVVVQPATVTEGGSGLNMWQVRRDATTALTAVATTSANVTDSGLSENTQYSYDVRFSDMVYNTSTYGTAATKYTLADTPTNLTGSAGTQSITLSVDSFTNDSAGSSGYYFSRSGANSGWITTNTWTDSGLSCGHSYSYSVKYRNGDGTETSVLSADISTRGCGGGFVAPTPPAPPTPTPVNPSGEFQVIINNNAASTNNREVSLSLVAGTNTSRMAISMSGDFNDAGVENYASTKTWDLCSSFNGLVKASTCPDGTYRVYVKYYSASGLASEIVSDSINLVTPVAPIVKPEKPPIIILPQEPNIPIIPKPPIAVTPTPKPSVPEPTLTPTKPTVPSTPSLPPTDQVPIFNDRPAQEALGRGQSYFGTLTGNVPILSSGDQPLKLIAGTTLKKSVKPLKAVNKIVVKIIFKKSQPTSLINTNLLKKIFLGQAAQAQEWQVAEYELTDKDGDGIYEADINLPSVSGEYEVQTIIYYADGTEDKSTTLTLIDPKGYIYESIYGKEARIAGAKVSLFVYDTNSNKFVLWPGEKFKQINPQYTERAGEYEYLVPAGKYFLQVEAPNYIEFKSGEFNVNEGDFVSQNIELHSSSFDMRWLYAGGLVLLGLLLGILLKRKKASPIM